MDTHEVIEQARTIAAKLRGLCEKARAGKQLAVQYSESAPVPDTGAMLRDFYDAFRNGATVEEYETRQATTGLATVTDYLRFTGKEATVSDIERIHRDLCDWRATCLPHYPGCKERCRHLTLAGKLERLADWLEAERRPEPRPADNKAKTPEAVTSSFEYRNQVEWDDHDPAYYPNVDAIVDARKAGTDHEIEALARVNSQSLYKLLRAPGCTVRFMSRKRPCRGKVHKQDWQRHLREQIGEHEHFEQAVERALVEGLRAESQASPDRATQPSSQSRTKGVDHIPGRRPANS